LKIIGFGDTFVKSCGDEEEMFCVCGEKVKDCELRKKIHAIMKI